MEDDIKQFFSENPFLWGILIALFGLFFLLAAIFNWSIIFGDVSTVTYDLRKIDGIINMFGRKAARIFVGVFGGVFIAGGLAWVYISLFVW